MSVCDKNCFECPYEDCIRDGMDLEDYKESRQRELTMHKTPEQKRAAAKQKAYYEANRDEIAAKQKAYREANREAYNAYMRDYLRRKRAEKKLTA